MNIKSIEEFTIGDCRSYLLQDSDSEVGKMVLAHLLTLLGEMEQKSKGETQSHKGEFGGHEWVDLGLSVKWATCNVGASAPSDHGDYFLWGEVISSLPSRAENAKTYNREMNSIAGDSQYDAASVNWGSAWRMPTKMEMNELISNCTWAWTTQGGYTGCKVTGPNGRSIFLPATGNHYNGSLYCDGKSGRYWSATPEGSRNAYELHFADGDVREVDWYPRYHGHSVRPVLREVL